MSDQEARRERISTAVLIAFLRDPPGWIDRGVRAHSIRNHFCKVAIEYADKLIELLDKKEEAICK